MPKAFITQKTLDRLYAGKNLRRAADREECDEELRGIAHQGFEKFIASRDSWMHPFDKEGRWFEDEDCESSILSKALFFELFSLMKKWGFVENLKLYETFGYRCEGAAEYGEGLLFHFDVMNNPKAARTIWRLGSMAKAKGVDELTFKDYRRTLGNLTPVPWWIERGRTARETDRNLQALHNDLAEWWDILLCYLQWRMGEFEGEGKPSFADYITLTCQFFYVENRSEDKDLFRRLLRGEIDAEGFCSEIEGSGGWREHVGIWAADLQKRRDNLRIVSLVRSGKDGIEFLELPESLTGMDLDDRNGTSFKKGFWQPDDKALPPYEHCTRERIEATDILIKNLIEVRSRCIMGLIDG